MHFRFQKKGGKIYKGNVQKHTENNYLVICIYCVGYAVFIARLRVTSRWTPSGNAQTMETSTRSGHHWRILLAPMEFSQKQ